MPNNFNDTKSKLRKAVIKANTLNKLINWLYDIISTDNKDYVAPETVLFYINETEQYLTKQYEHEKGGQNGK